ncbi:MAG: nuclease-related domain-containing protein [Anaerolineales bacterium]
MRDYKSYKLGRDGERAVGQSLEELRAFGFSVLHDLLGEGFNLDHALFTNKGIFVIETKTISKPTKGPAVVSFRGKQILVNGYGIDRDPITQVVAQAHWLAEVLQKSTGKQYPVKGVVVFPGWFVEPMPKSIKERAWVLSPKALIGFISHEPVRLKEDEVHMAVYHLSRHIRLPKQD